MVIPDFLKEWSLMMVQGYQRLHKTVPVYDTSETRPRLGLMAIW
jgi:hypothetical protein